MAVSTAPPIFGILRGNGLLSGLAAWFAFTMPSALILFVGILGAALYNPVWTSAVLTPRDFVVALAGFLLLMAWKLAHGSSSCCWRRQAPFCG